MQKLSRLLRALGLSFYGCFLICALITSVTGVVLVLSGNGEAVEGSVGKAFYISFLLTVITGLLVSGTRSALGLTNEGRDGQPTDPTDGPSGRR